VVSNPQRTFLFSVYALQVDRVLKGTSRAGEGLYVRPGGATRKFLSRDSRYPDLPDGDYVLFLHSQGEGVFTASRPLDAFSITREIATSVDPGVASSALKAGLSTDDLALYLAAVDCSRS